MLHERSDLIQETLVSSDARTVEGSVKFGRWQVQPLGGGIGCFTMILISVVASIALTVLLNLLTR